MQRVSFAHVRISPAIDKVCDEARAEGEARGEARGEIRGEARGEIRGEARGEARAILTLLDARGLAVSDTVRARILGCTDLATLDRWVRRAATARTAAAIVRPPRTPR